MSKWKKIANLINALNQRTQILEKCYFLAHSAVHYAAGEAQVATEAMQLDYNNAWVCIGCSEWGPSNATSARSSQTHIITSSTATKRPPFSLTRLLYWLNNFDSHGQLDKLLKAMIVTRGRWWTSRAKGNTIDTDDWFIRTRHSKQRTSRSTHATVRHKKNDLQFLVCSFLISLSIDFLL